jgi:hypothetical protein
MQKFNTAGEDSVYFGDRASTTVRGIGRYVVAASKKCLGNTAAEHPYLLAKKASSRFLEGLPGICSELQAVGPELWLCLIWVCGPFFDFGRLC